MLHLVDEQRNPYKGEPARPWVRVDLIGEDGREQSLELLADTGCPFAIVVGRSKMKRFSLGGAESVPSNFGRLIGGWFRVAIPDIGFDEEVLGFASDRIVEDVQQSHKRFRGLAGLPLLRMMSYGGDFQSFWVRR